MRKVATAVGITPMALYRHYLNRDGLLTALADAGFDQLAERLAGLRLTGHFLERDLLTERRAETLAARARLVDRLKRAVA